MEQLVRPRRLSAGDTIATISLSGGRAGDPDMRERYHIGKARLQELFGLRVVETANALKGTDFLYKHPQARVDDLMEALQRPDIKGILCNQGGDDAYRLLRYIDYSVIRNNPKVFLGFSDISTVHNMFTYAGVSSFYGPNVLTPIAQPGELDAYTYRWLRKVLFSTDAIGDVEPSEFWTKINYNNVPKEEIVWTKNTGYHVLQGSGVVQGRLLGGCTGPMQQIMGTAIFPATERWSDSIVFLEIGSPYGSALAGLHLVRAFAATGMFRHARALICTKMSEEDEQILLKVVRDEEGLPDLPILTNVNFGHKTPMTVLPIGAMAEVNCDTAALRILDPGVEP
jgi:muramoyltetrapeptide carboxypeptidase LdcA involved in peptidoglycan recycling